MDDIAAEIGLAKTTLYHYFSSKEEILREIHEEFINLLLAGHAARVHSGLRPEQMLLEAMADILELMQTHRGHVRVFFESHRELLAPARAAVRASRDEYEDIIRSLVESCITLGIFRAADPRLVTLGIFGMCNWAYQWYPLSSNSRVNRPREIAYSFWNYLVFGLASEELRADSRSWAADSRRAPARVDVEES